MTHTLKPRLLQLHHHPLHLFRPHSFGLSTSKQKILRFVPYKQSSVNQSADKFQLAPISILTARLSKTAG